VFTNVQLGGALSLLCPGAPRIPFLLGRPQPKAPSPPNLIPEPFDIVTTILDRFASVGFSPQEVVALLSAHFVAEAETGNPAIPECTHYYSGVETLLTTL
jgi:manganese peroxidase